MFGSTATIQHAKGDEGLYAPSVGNVLILGSFVSTHRHDERVGELCLSPITRAATETPQLLHASWHTRAVQVQVQVPRCSCAVPRCPFSSCPRMETCEAANDETRVRSMC